MISLVDGAAPNPILAAALNGQSTIPVARVNPYQGRRILLVEDDPDLLQNSAEIFTRLGYRVGAAADGERGWAALLARSYDLLITDNDLPRLSGIELLKRLRQAGMNVPVILVSGSFTYWEWKRDPCLEVAATLQQPYLMGELVETVSLVFAKVAAAPHEQRPIG